MIKQTRFSVYLLREHRQDKHPALHITLLTYVISVKRVLLLLLVFFLFDPQIHMQNSTVEQKCQQSQLGLMWF